MVVENVIPQISSVAFLGRMADRKAYGVNVTYPGEDTKRIVFTANTGEVLGQIIMVTSTLQTVVDQPERFGNVFGPLWVRRFFGHYEED